MSELSYLPPDLLLRAHNATLDNDDPHIFDAVIRVVQAAYKQGYDDGYSRGLIYKEAQAMAERDRARRRAEAESTQESS